MKKILSLILCGLFLNFMSCPLVFAADDADAPAAEVQDTTTVQQDDAQTVQTVSSASDVARTEHLQIRKKKSKKINVESVYVSSHGVEIPAQDILQIAFINDFNGRKAHVGDTIEFRFPNDIVTQEGTVIIPSSARVIAVITDLKKPKPLHLSGKVYLDFKYVEIDGVKKPLDAKLYSKKDFLSRKTLNNTTAVGETAVMAGAGAAAGAAITAATATDVAVIVFGSACTAGLGALVGVTVGILLPGASFKAKAGQTVNIQLTSELDI
ncbi:hypothetical protein IKP85_00360 [bacterium]|nr:hypothetical protein [bacterium]